MSGKIYTGFTGIGKSTASRKGLAVDLDCGGFDDDIEAYINAALKVTKSGRDVLIAGYRWYREYMLENNIPYTAVLPPLCDKDVYKKRLYYRGMGSRYVSNIYKKWEYHLEILEGETTVVLPPEGFISDFLESQKWLKGVD